VGLAHAKSGGSVTGIDELLPADAAKTGRPHIFGPAAVMGSLLDTFNKVDALISDVSSVIPDFLYSESRSRSHRWSGR
jgi:hypothetical protein